jgi:excisionase family DNA binding protein
MSDLTIREASRLIGRTPATLRRYIRSGRLHAEKEVGKFGEEYRIRRDDLLALGFSPADPVDQPSGSLVHTPSTALALPLPAEAVPISLYNELLMKHEQILVQYGMIRAGGQKLLEFKADAEQKTEELRRQQERYQTLRQRALKEIGLLRKRVREMEIALEERNIAIAVLEERVKHGDEPPRERSQPLHEILAQEDRPQPTVAVAASYGAGFPPLDRKDDH